MTSNEKTRQFLETYIPLVLKGNTYGEIGKIMGLTAGQVANKVHSLRRKLKKLPLPSNRSGLIDWKEMEELVKELSGKTS